MGGKVETVTKEKTGDWSHDLFASSLLFLLSFLITKSWLNFIVYQILSFSLIFSFINRDHFQKTGVCIYPPLHLSII